MTDADAPRMPDIRWHLKWGLMELEDGVVSLVSEGRTPVGEYLGQQGSSFTPPIPGAVKLGDVEAAHRAQRIAEERCTRVARELDDLKEEIGEIVDAYSGDHICDLIRDVIERTQIDG